MNCIFTIDIPVHLPYPIPATQQRDLITREYENFQQKCLKHPEKSQNYQVLCNETSYFRAGNEPYMIIKKGEKLSWRGFLKLYKPNFEGRDREHSQNVRSVEGAKLLKPGKYIPNLDRETHEVNRLIQLFRDEAFGLNSSESREQFSKKIQMTLLLNRVRSISSTRNKSMKRYTEDLDTDPSVLLIRAFWEPKWVKKVGAKFTAVPFQEVRHFFLEYLHRNPDDAMKFLIKQEGDILGETLGGSTHVPYRQFREAIRIHPVKSFMVDKLRRSNPGASLFECTHDSDLVQLRIQRDGSCNEPADGLYSFYEEIINQFHQVNHQIPPLISTGYRAAYQSNIDEEIFPWIFSALEEDRYVRQEISRVHPAMAYYPEPNCLFYVQDSMNSLPYSFLGDDVKWSLTKTTADFTNYESPSESKIIFHQLHPTAVLFDASHPAIMKLPARMLVSKKRGSSFNLDELGHFDSTMQRFQASSIRALKVSENIAQSPLSFRDLAVNFYNQYGLTGLETYYDSHSKVKVDLPNTLFTSLVSSIFNAFDPVDFVEKDQMIGALPTLSQVYYDQHPKRLEMKTNLKCGNDLIKDELTKINECKNFADQIGLLEALVDSIYGNGVFKTLYLSARALGRIRFQHIYFYFVQGLRENRRCSPIKAIQDTRTLQYQDTSRADPTPAAESDEFGEVDGKPSSILPRTPPRMATISVSRPQTTPTMVSEIAQEISPDVATAPPLPRAPPSPLKPSKWFRNHQLRVIFDWVGVFFEKNFNEGRKLFAEEPQAAQEELNGEVIRFPEFSRPVFQSTLKQLYERLGQTKDSREALSPVFGFKNQTAFYTALNLSNTSNNTYQSQWEKAKSVLPSFCQERKISLREILDRAVESSGSGRGSGA